MPAYKKENSKESVLSDVKESLNGTEIVVIDDGSAEIDYVRIRIIK